MLPFFGRLFAKPEIAAPQVPPGTRVYAIGDIHGRRDLLEQATSLISGHIGQSTPAHCLIVFVGDYVDRGSDSRGVLDHIAGGSLPAEVIALRGNHEAMLLNFLGDDTVIDTWRRYGGLETLSSYGVPVQDIMRGRGFSDAQIRFTQALGWHREFLEATKLHAQIGDYFFCHAGVRPGVPLDGQREEDLLWIREEFLQSNRDFGKVIIHGHTPQDAPDVRANRINIDTGAYATSKLTILVLEGATRAFLSTG